MEISVKLKVFSENLKKYEDMSLFTVPVYSIFHKLCRQK